MVPLIVIEDVIYSGPEVTCMCPAVAFGLGVAAGDRLLTQEMAARIKEMSDLMATFAKEERDAKLEEWDRRIARAKASARRESE